MKTKLLIIISFFGLNALSQNYILDSNFGNSGLVTTSFGSNINYLTSMELQNDGKIVACGNYENGNYNTLVISRYNNDGTLDNTFGTLGKITTSIVNYGITSIFKLKLQNDGKILIGGTTGNSVSSDNFILIRLNTDGSFDNSFGINGIVITDINNRSNAGFNIEIQSDNKILLAGYTESTEYENFAVTRYNSNGTLDNSFGNLGIVSLNIGNSNIHESIDGIKSIKLQSNGKIILGGYSDATSTVEKSNFAMIRLNTDGTLDTSFGILGKIITDIGGDDGIISLNITSDDKIIASGTIYYPNSISKLCFVKYNIDGDIDTTFGNNGIVISQINNTLMNDINYQTNLQSDGKILCVGDSSGNFFISRYNSNGTIDNTFNSIGYLITDFYGGYDVAYSLITQINGSFIIGGGATSLAQNVTFALAKYKIENLSNTNFSKNKDFEIYPNPSKGYININNLKNYLITEINIFDMQGKNIFNEKSNFNKINIENLSNGIYNLKIISETENFNYKIIKE